MVDTALPAFRKNKKLDNLKHNFQQINSLGEKNSDKKFYVIRINYGGGLFSIVLYVLSEIRYAESINAIPIVDMEYFISKYNEDKRIKKLIIRGNIILKIFQLSIFKRFMRVKT